MKKPLVLPQFMDEDEERVFWDEVDLGDYLEPSDFKHAVFPNLKPTSEAISLRIPAYLLARVKEKANAMGVPYQALIKQFIAKGMEQ